MGTTFRNIIVAAGVVLIAAGCNILDGSPTPKLVVESNGAFNGIYTIDGKAAKTVTSNSDFTFFARVDYEDSVYAQVTKADATSELTVYLLEDGDRLYEAGSSSCYNEFTVLFGTKNRSEVFGGAFDSGDIKTAGKETDTSGCLPSTTSEPDVLTGLTADTTDASTINVSWDDPNDSTIVQYVVYYVTDVSDFGSESTDQQASFSPGDLTDTGGILTAIITGLTSGTTYYFQVVAVNTGGTSDRTNTETATTD